MNDNISEWTQKVLTLTIPWLNSDQTAVISPCILYCSGSLLQIVVHILLTQIWKLWPDSQKGGSWCKWCQTRMRFEVVLLTLCRTVNVYPFYCKFSISYVGSYLRVSSRQSGRKLMQHVNINPCCKYLALWTGVINISANLS